MKKYRLVAKKGEGTFSEVLKAQNIQDGKYYAIKCMKNKFDSIDQVNNLREIQALRRLSPNEHIITLEEVLYDQPTGRLALVFELMEANLYELIRGRRHYLSDKLVLSYMHQLFKSLDHMHRKGIFHRDIKPENILIESSTNSGPILKLADFGSCRGIYSKQPYTEYISTRWYRSPECLVTDGYYGPEMDLWGAGCVFFEITSLYPLFPGTNELDQINRIHKVLGTPGSDVLAKLKRNGASHINFDFPYQKGIGISQLIPHGSAECVDLITKLLCYDSGERMTAREALRHPYFREVREQNTHMYVNNSVNNCISNIAAPSVTAKEADEAETDSEAISVSGSVISKESYASKFMRKNCSTDYDSRIIPPTKINQDLPKPTVSKALPTISAQQGMKYITRVTRFGGIVREQVVESAVNTESLGISNHSLKSKGSNSKISGALSMKRQINKVPEQINALPPIMGVSGRGNGTQKNKIETQFGSKSYKAANGGFVKKGDPIRDQIGMKIDSPARTRMGFFDSARNVTKPKKKGRNVSEVLNKGNSYHDISSKGFNLGKNIDKKEPKVLGNSNWRHAS